MQAIALLFDFHGVTTTGPGQIIKYQAGEMLGDGRMLVLTNNFNPLSTPVTPTT